MEKNNSLLYGILSGVVTCFICVGMIFLFPSKGNSNLKENSSKLNFSGEIALGDGTACTSCIAQCIRDYPSMIETQCRTSMCSSQCADLSTPTPTATANSCVIQNCATYVSPRTAANCYCQTCGTNYVPNSNYTACESASTSTPTPTVTSTPTPTATPLSPVCSSPCCIYGSTAYDTGACSANMPEGARTCGACGGEQTTPMPTVTATPTPKSCVSISEAGECSARDDCEWDYTYLCHDKGSVLSSATGGGEAYVTPETCKTFHIVAKDSDNHGVNANWKVTGGTHNTATCSYGSTCTVTVCGWGCGNCSVPSETLTVTASRGGISKSATITVKSYRTWHSYKWEQAPNSAEYIYNGSALDNGTCTAYSEPYTQNGVKKYKLKWDRCCCTGGGSNPTPTPSTDTYDFCCVNGDKTDYQWLKDQTSKTCPSGYTIDSTKTSKLSCEPAKVPACYIDDDGEYQWTSEQKSSWKKVEGITKEADCQKEENPACYLDKNGEYTWGKYAKTDGYTLVTSIKDEANCKKQETAACYMSLSGDYIWTVTPPSGYTKIEGITKAEDCAQAEEPACYVHGNGFVWGKYDKVTGYIRLWDVTDEKDCQLPDSDACYIDPKGNYVWGKYGNDSSYTLVPAVTAKTSCNNEVPVPSTASNVSKLIYVFMAILMACGISFIYYSSVIKKQNQ